MEFIRIIVQKRHCDLDMINNYGWNESIKQKLAIAIFCWNASYSSCSFDFGVCRWTGKFTASPWARSRCEVAHWHWFDSRLAYWIIIDNCLCFSDGDDNGRIRIENTDTGTTLTILGAKNDDAGRYRLTCSNEYGSDTSDVYVQISQ